MRYQDGILFRKHSSLCVLLNQLPTNAEYLLERGIYNVQEPSGQSGR